MFGTSLTNAWLEAVARVQSGHVPQPRPAQSVQTMTEVIERALRDAGPPQREPHRTPHTNHEIDRLA